jgi:hypothetical protein
MQIRKAAEDSRTPQPCGSNGTLGKRASVLECGCPLPLRAARLANGLPAQSAFASFAAAILIFFLCSHRNKLQ